MGYAAMLEQVQGAALDPSARAWVSSIRTSALQMASLIDGLLSFSKARHAPLRRTPVDLSALAGEIGRVLAETRPEPPVRFRVREGLEAAGDPALLRAVLENLLGKAWKYSSRTPSPDVEFGAEAGEEGPVFFIRDNGAGFDGNRAEEVFEPFRRLHGSEEFPGTGVGLATVRRIVERHGGLIRAEGSPGKGATFRWTLPRVGAGEG